MYINLNQGLFREYEDKYYQACVRETAQQVVVVMVTDCTNPSLSILVARIYVDKTFAQEKVRELCYNVIKHLRQAGVTNILFLSYDQEFAGYHQEDTEGGAISVLELRRQAESEANVTHRTQDKEKRVELAQRIMLGLSKLLGTDHGVDLIEDDLVYHVTGMEIDEAIVQQALQSDITLRRVCYLQRQGKGDDVGRVLDVISRVLINKHMRFYVRAGRINLNEANEEQLASCFRGCNTDWIPELIQARSTRVQPFCGMHELPEQVQQLLPRRKVMVAFDGQAYVPEIKMSLRYLDDLRGILARILFAIKIDEISKAPVVPEFPRDAGPFQTFTGGADFTAATGSRVRKNFCRPVYFADNLVPQFNMACWVHIFKRPRCAVSNGHKAKAPTDQQEYYRDYEDVVEHTKGKLLSKAELKGFNAMSVDIPRRMFSRRLVELLRERGHHKTADFAHHMHNFFESLDARYWDLEERMAVWKEVYEWLSNLADIFDVGEYVQGIPKVTWESMLVFLSSLMQMCAYLKEKHPEMYNRLNTRAVNNDQVENFFSCLGFHTKKQLQNRYHAVVEETEKKLSEETDFLYPWSSRKRMLSDTKPFNDRDEHGTTDEKREAKLFKNVWGESNGKSLFGRGILFRAGCKASNEGYVEDTNILMNIV